MTIATPDDLKDFCWSDFSHGGVTHPVYAKGAGPAVIVIHEAPTITPEVARFARKVADAGLSVHAPLLFGTAGQPASKPAAQREVLRLCVSRQFRLLAANKSSPIVDWLRALARDLHGAHGGPGVGVIGLCLTGNFALSMMAEPAVIAPVLGQPSLPLAVTRGRGAAFQATAAEFQTARRRCREEGLTVLGLRFEGDPLCPAARFETLRRELGSAFEAIELPASAANPEGISPPHSMLTTELIDEEGQPTRAALDHVLGFFSGRLMNGADPKLA